MILAGRFIIKQCDIRNLLSAMTSPTCQTTQKTGRLVRSSRFYTIAGRDAYVASTSVSRTTSNMGGSTRMASIS